MTNLAEQIDIDQELEQQALTLTGQALAVKVTDQATYAKAGEVDKALRDMEKQIQEFFKPIKQSIDATKKTVLDKEKAELAPIQSARATLRDGMNHWLNEEERKRREEQARLEAIERERVRKEQEKLLAQAAKAEEKGKTEKAEALMEKAEDLYEKPVHVESMAAPVRTETATVGAQKDVVVEVVNLKAFVAELVAQNSNAFEALFTVKASALKAWAKSNGVKKFAGLHIEEKLSARVR